MRADSHENKCVGFALNGASKRIQDHENRSRFGDSIVTSFCRNWPSLDVLYLGQYRTEFEDSFVSIMPSTVASCRYHDRCDCVPSQCAMAHSEVFWHTTCFQHISMESCRFSARHISLEYHIWGLQYDVLSVEIGPCIKAAHPCAPPDPFELLLK